ncbi:related to Acyl-coenzyme A:6-aminopenicillanic-acid-acyltransferase 40 kDa form [Phialocephala subalpina]|uniref:Related to Acyl-coenzyme A:6-aminopenicillanic-acid-acyltransferase 40 kDa form n=1 Tax=Phialocephala subalpina TaxID=576137 RepID=A0A1L7WHS9_9HELO|nr:related to Acyl-coenzyme A:6-aminopenicillanic-acid-acyltransferase 40 kDa form [Phialocephala subalpina]
MRKVNCSGMPFEIGVQHGRQAREEIHSSLAFYTELYQRKSKMDWNTASHRAEEFIPVLEKDWPDYVEEIKGVGEGSDLPFTTILAMNIRTEISMGMFSDGCTSFAWKTDDVSLLAQNWDWEEPQQNNLIYLNITQNGKPSISMITEAGLIGKIGMNSAGVGVCLNAIRARGVDYGRLPVHLALRATLDSNSRLEAIAKLEKAGVAAAAHLLIADSTGTTSIEFSHRDLVKIGTSDGRICHSNHFLVEHADGVSETVFGQDSRDRMVKATKLLQGAAEREKPPTVQTIQKMLEDEEGYPGAINRAALGASSTATSFGIVMELKSKTAKVRIGRPTQCKGTMLLRPPGV